MSQETIGLWVQPRSSLTRLAGEREGLIVIRLAAPPVEGAANAALVRFLAERLGVALGRVQLVRGHGGRRKWIRVEGITAAEVRRRLLHQAEAAESEANAQP